MFSFSSK